MQNKELDPTGVWITPGGGEENCDGCPECCDECDYFLDCFPEYEQKAP